MNETEFMREIESMAARLNTRMLELDALNRRLNEKDAKIRDLQQGVIESETVLTNFQAEMERERRNFAEEARTRQREVNPLRSQLLIAQSALTRKGLELQQLSKNEEPRFQTAQRNFETRLKQFQMVSEQDKSRLKDELECKSMEFNKAMEAAVKRAEAEKNVWQTRLDQRQGEIDRLRADMERSADKLAAAQKVIEKEIANRRNFEEENIQLKSGVIEAKLKSEQAEKSIQFEIVRRSLEKDLAIEKEREKLREEEKKLEAEFKTKMEQLLESLYEIKGDGIDALREQLESQTKIGKASQGQL